MTTLARVTMPNLGGIYAVATAGTAPGWTACSAGPDLIPISSGQGTLLGFRTTSTGVTITLDSVTPTQFGTDVNVTIVMAAVDEKWVWLDNDGYNRFDQGAGVNPGLVSVSYSVNPSAFMTFAAVTIQ